MATDSARPAMLPRFLIVVLGLAGLAFGIQFIQGLQTIVAPVFLALNLVVVVHPLQAYLISKRVPAIVAASITVVLVMALLVVFFALNAWAIAELVIVLPSYSDNLAQLYGEVISFTTSWGLTPEVIQNQLSAFDFSSLTDTALKVLSNVSAIVALLTTVIMTVFFVIMDSLQFPARLREVAHVAPQFSFAMRSFGKGVRRYWVVATIFGLIVAVFDVIALWIIGVPLALVWGVLAFTTNYIPNVGLIIGLIPPALMALLEGGWWDAMWVVIAYLTLNFVIQSIIQPKFTGESVGVTPFISFLSLLFWYWVLGPLGALLALPATLLLKALLVDADPRARWINLLISSGFNKHTGKVLATSAAPISPAPTSEAELSSEVAAISEAEEDSEPTVENPESPEDPDNPEPTSGDAVN
ncbi:AI-2E family transporter [Brevibacterium sp. UMB1308A]|uniref:AI-2E family transporter n=1 Tax=Brevibacterium sp. UMB1308A TaxID=3050608 RepID=UPI00254A7CC9|nr:AI-2E family transporter [Brevibacterium sp. UMB1308A]MDK8347258.1 AI-2E family transporter [Brevibacterium sp. UMB1308B]MDK8714200.1 AI-2E family transporter [Brevibacterium sp. UMB1308A]